MAKSLEPTKKVKKPRKSRAKASEAKDPINQDDEVVDGAQDLGFIAAKDPSEPTRHGADDEPELASKKKRKSSGKKTKTSKTVVSEGEANDGDAFEPAEDVPELAEGKEGEAPQPRTDEGPPVTKPKPKKSRNSKAKLAAQDEDDDPANKESATLTPFEPSHSEVSYSHPVISF